MDTMRTYTRAIIMRDLESEEIGLTAGRLFEYRFDACGCEFGSDYIEGLEVWEVLGNGEKVTASWDIENRVAHYILRRYYEERG
jgi:hypothetical protein